MEGSHSGLVRPPAKRLGDESPLMGSNPIPSAAMRRSYIAQESVQQR